MSDYRTEKREKAQFEQKKKSLGFEINSFRSTVVRSEPQTEKTEMEKPVFFFNLIVSNGLVFQIGCYNHDLYYILWLLRLLNVFEMNHYYQEAFIIVLSLY